MYMCIYIDIYVYMYLLIYFNPLTQTLEAQQPVPMSKAIVQALDVNRYSVHRGLRRPCPQRPSLRQRLRQGFKRVYLVVE